MYDLLDTCFLENRVYNFVADKCEVLVMKRFLIILLLVLSASGLFAESKILFQKERGLSYLYLYEVSTEENHYFYIYAKELKDVGIYNVIKIRSYDKQKLRDVIEYFLEHDGLQQKFLENIEELDYITLVKKETEFTDNSKMKVNYNFFVE